jgi:NADH-quinone oxidoreductase subunit L
MGGLRKELPVTHICFLIGCLAIAGIPPLSGFFSKEQILLAAYQNNRPVYWIGLITSGITAFYMFRLYFSLFWRKTAQQQPPDSPGEGGFAMMFPLLLLGTGAALGGFVPFGKLVSSDGIPLETTLHLGFSIAPVLLGLLGIALASWLYKKDSPRPGKIAEALGSLYHVTRKKFYIDEIYLFITRRILFNLVGRPAAWFDRHIVDGIVNLAGKTTESLSVNLKKIQSGKVQHYAIYFLAAAISLAILVIYVWR